MRTSSNPAFRNLPGRGRGGAGFGPGRGAPDTARAGADQRPLTVDDVVLKTAITAGVALVTGVLTAISGLYVLVLPAFIIGLVVSLIIIFRQSSNPALVLTYSAAMGVALGGISGLFDRIYPGIAAQAIIGTAGVFLGMLVVYKTGAVRVTPRFQRWMMGALIGVVVLVLVRFISEAFFGDALGMGDGGFLAIAISLLIIGVAAFSLLLDFDAADQAIREGAPASLSWYIAFGLMTTLVWLYIEILRLLSYFRE